MSPDRSHSQSWMRLRQVFHAGTSRWLPSDYPQGWQGGRGSALPVDRPRAPAYLRPRSMRIAEETISDRTWFELPQQAENRAQQQKLGLHILATADGAFNRLKDNLIIPARRDVMKQPEFCRSCVG